MTDANSAARTPATSRLDEEFVAEEPTRIDGMDAYGPEHLTVLGLFAVLIPLIVAWTRRWGHTPAGARAIRGAGWLLLALAVAWQVADLLPSRFDATVALPFHLSDWLRFITAYALITRARWAMDVCFYWGLTLNVMAVLTPDLHLVNHPVVDFAQYWTFHAANLIAPFVFVAGLGHRPTWRGFARTSVLTVVWALTGLAVNALTGANYGFLAHKPVGASALDLMGPWPVYLFVAAAVLFAVFAVMTWPFERWEEPFERQFARERRTHGGRVAH